MNPGGIQLLLVEDNPGDSRLVREMLRGVSDITVAGVDSLAAAEGHLASREVDVVLLDLGLPDSQGLDTLARVRARYPALPVIVFTGLDDEDTALKAVKSGAQDYLVKGRFDEYSLTRAIRYAVERQRAETSLRKSEERYRTLFNEMPVGVYRTGEDGRIQDANPALAVLFGYASPDEMVGLNVRDFYADPEEQLRWREAVKREGVLHDAEIRVRRKDGTLIWALDSGRIVRDQPGLLTYFEGTLSDVTERKRAEGQLRYQATLLASVNDAIVASDAQFRLTSWNPAAEAMYGWREEEVLGQDGLEIVRTEWPDVEAMEMRRTIAETGHWRGEATQQRKDGTRFPVEVNSRVLRDESGQITDYISANRDITERKQAEQALRDSEERYRTVVQSAGDAIISIDSAGGIVGWNAGAERMFGYAEGEIRGQRLTRLLPAPSVAGHLAGMDRLRTGGETQIFGRALEAEGSRKDGQVFPLELSLSEWRVADESYFTAIIRDITERKQAKDALEESEEKFRALAEASLFGIYAYREKFVYVNPAFSTLTGYTVAELLDMSFWDLVHPEFRDLVRQRGSARLRGEKVPEHYEIKLVRKDGSELWISAAATATRLGGEPTGIGIFTDITERKQAQDNLAASEAELRALFAAMTDVVIVYNADGRYLKIAPTNLASLYRPLDDILGKTVHEILPKEQADYIFAKIGEALLTDQVVHGEYALQVDGKEVWFGSSASRIAENTIIWVAHDITNRKQAEERIQRQVETLGVLYELSRALSAMDDFNAILDLVTRHTAESAHVTFACVLLLEQDDLVLRAAYPVRLLDQDLQVGQREPLAAHPLFQRVLEENAPRVLESDSLEGLECAPFYLGVLQSLCIVPLHVRERPFGLLMLCETRHGAREPFTVEKLRLASSIGDQAVSSLQRALLHEETGRQLGQLAALHQIDQAIAGSIDMRLTLNVVLEHVASQLNVDAASALLLDPHSHTLDFVAGRGFRTGSPKDIHLRLGEGYAGRAALERKAIHIPDLRHRGTDILRSPLVSAEGFVSYHCVPLIAKGQVKGVLEVFHRAWRDDDAAWVNYMETLAGQAAIAIDNAQLFENLQRSNVGLMLAYDATIEGWSRALDMRDKETEGHTQRVTEMTLHMARMTGLSEEELVHVRRGALLHDMGKLGVPDSILLKPGELTEAEWVLMRKHPTFAYEMLSPITYLHPALDIPYCHHEKWDGSGYPRGLKAEQIPKAARIFALVDVFDALRSDRPYRPAWPLAKAVDHIRSLSGSHFDPDLVEPFLADVIAG